MEGNDLSLTDDSAEWSKAFAKEYDIPENKVQCWFAHAIEVGRHFGSKISHRNVTSSKLKALLDSGLFVECEFHVCHYWCSNGAQSRTCIRLLY